MVLVRRVRRFIVWLRFLEFRTVTRNGQRITGDPLYLFFADGEFSQTSLFLRRKVGLRYLSERGANPCTIFALGLQTRLNVGHCTDFSRRESRTEHGKHRFRVPSERKRKRKIQALRVSGIRNW